jgi:hypothetical protein
MNVNGVTLLCSKGGAGGGKMVSGLKSRTFGFGFDLSSDDLEQVNNE